MAAPPVGRTPIRRTCRARTRHRRREPAIPRQTTHLDRTLAIVFGIAALALPFILDALGAGYYLSLASRIVIYAIAATSLNLVLGYAGLVSFGHAAFVGLGAYATGILVSEGVVGSGWHLLATAGGHRAGGARDRCDLAAHARRLLHHDHAGVRADAVLSGELGEGLWRRRGPQHQGALGARLRRVRDRPEESARPLVRRGRRARRFAARAGALRPVAPRPRGAGAARRRRARRGARLSDLSAEARGLRRRRRARRRRGRALGQPAGLRQSERAALDAVGHADGDGDPRRRRDGVGRPGRRRRAAAAAGGAGGVHRALGVLDRLGAARGGAVRAPGSGRLARIGPPFGRAARR